MNDKIKDIDDIEPPRAENVDPEFGELLKWFVNQKKEIRNKIDVIRNTDQKIGRNDLCPCLSGKKYKHCCMK